MTIDNNNSVNNYSVCIFSHQGLGREIIKGGPNICIVGPG